MDEDILKGGHDPVDALDGDPLPAEPRRDEPPPLLFVPDADMEGGAEDRSLEDPGFFLKDLQGLHDPVAGDLEDRVPDDRRLELPGAPPGHDPAGVDEPDIVAVLGLVEVMRRHEDGDAPLREVVDELPEAPPRSGV